MRFYFTCLLLVVYLFSLNNSIAQSTDDTMTAQKVLENAIQSLGGREYLQSINTLYTDAIGEMDGREVHFIIKEKLPNKGAFQIVYQGNIVYEEWYNGKEGQNRTNNKIHKANRDEFKNKKYKKNIFDELDYLDSSLWKIELLSSEQVNNKDCYKIQATLVNGYVRQLDYSKDSFHLIKTVSINKEEKYRSDSSFCLQYKTLGQLTYCSEEDEVHNGEIQKLKTVAKIINAKVSDEDFDKSKPPFGN